MKTIYGLSLLKTTLIASFTVLSVSLGYTYKFHDDFRNTQVLLNNEKSILIRELKDSKYNIELAIAESSTLKKELLLERKKVSNLLIEISNNNIDAAAIIKYKNEINRLNNVIVFLNNDRKALIKNNEIIKQQRDSTILVLSNAKKYSDTLTAMNVNLNGVIAKGSKISVINLKTLIYKQDKSGGLVYTDQAKKANILNVSFIVIGNKIAKPCHKEFYVQVIDSEHNVLGENSSKKFGESILYYSFAYPVKFQNESIEINKNILFHNVEKGTYMVNLFEKDNLISKTSFVLR